MNNKLLLYCNDNTRTCVWTYKGYSLTNGSVLDYDLMSKAQQTCDSMDPDRLKDIAEGMKLIIQMDGVKV